MKSMRWWLPGLLLVLSHSPVSAFHPRVYGILGGGGGFLGFTKVHHNRFFHFSIGHPGRAFNPYFYPPGLSRRRTEIYFYAPPPPPPVILQPAPVLVPQPRVDLEMELIEQLFPRQAPPQIPPPPVNPPNRIPPQQPKKNDNDVQPMPAPPKKVNPPPVVPPHLPPRKAPDLIPRTEDEKQIVSGKQAFAQQQYGLAAERFRKAVDLAPNKPLGHFLLGQSLFALSKYRRAYQEIILGLLLDPDWETGDFRPLDLYGPVADYAAHQMNLEKVLADHPDDPLLLFLYAYQLWFDGRRVEARPVLERLAPDFQPKDIIERFLKAFPNAPVI